MTDFLFDGTTKYITEPSGSGNTEFDVKTDIYSAWKRWVMSGDGSKYPTPFSVEGGTPIGATGLFTGDTIILVNGWKLQGASHDHIVTLIGNLFSDDNILSVQTTGYSVLMNVVSTVGAQGIATGSAALTTAQATQLEELHQLNALGSATVTMPKESGTLDAGDIQITVTDNGSSHTLTRQ